MTDLAHVLEGEAGVCQSFIAFVAVAWVWSRNPVMYGWSPPSRLAIMAAYLWRYLPDPTGGALYMVSGHDLSNPAVRQFTSDRGPPLWRADCGNGYSLHAYGG